MIKSPLRYPGGKNKALDRIIPLIPDFKEYREAFIGGGSVFLAAKQKYGDRDDEYRDEESKKSYWINDLYYSIYNFWKCCQTNQDDMIRLLFRWKNEYAGGEGKEGKEKGHGKGKVKLLEQYLRVNNHKFSDAELAAAYFVQNRSSFSGLGRSFTEYSYEERFTKSSIESLRYVSGLLQGVKITNLDYEDVVKAPVLDNIRSDDVFIYLDPPYFNVSHANLYGKRGGLHQWFDHQRFANVMKECDDKYGYRWLITYDDSGYIRKLFDWANIESWELQYSMSHKKTNMGTKCKMGKEIFISNYDISMVRKNIESKQMDIESAWSM